MRETRFDLNQLARVAADSVGAGQYISIKKYPDGMFNKTFLMTMDNGQEVVSKVPNPNAGVPHFTTASEVATMDFARKVLDTPVPQVYLWNSQAESHPVGAEFIIMDKVKSVPLSQVWGTTKLPQKLKVLLAITRIQKKWLSVSFSHYGSLYYAGDVQQYSNSSYYVKDGNTIESSGFTIGPIIARDWLDGARSKLLDINRGPYPDNPENITVIEFRKTPAYGLIFLAHRMYEDGEAHFQSLLVDLKDSWASLPSVTSNTPSPFDFSQADIERIKLDSDAAVAGTDLVLEAKESLGDLWPDKGFIEHAQYDDCKAALDNVKCQILEQLAETEEEKAEYKRYWPFD
ncbi:hypothetical protein AOCH_004733 [Aspergillus ochraceoroseus]|uniref:Altered inheritance of mitochondria protein 9, mitochondrial n=1 Tax=Aspergillus ochraceoroseus TaxID=138278 RepID=A0A0F8WJH8_9EURO|nr:hypothetical protein AOCH_004733 [Aspergillus ochraceoroseus]